MRKRPTISLCLIAKNEIHNIKPLFDSIEGCFDEIIFVDTGSNDGTPDFAKALGAKVYHFDWVNDFSKARQFAFDQATCDYMFWCDLDDSLSHKDEFIKWRDNVMSLGDYWIANYHYAYDFEKDMPLCTFPRERVIKNDKSKFKWKYFVHEGLMPIDGHEISPQFISTWNIVHRRSPKDFEADRSRNLNLFDVNQDKLDSRMMFYWGKELYENGKIKECIPKLAQAFEQLDLAIHDRVLCIQYLCYAYLKEGDFNRAFQLAQVGINLDANRAEFHIAMGDAKIGMKDYINAIPFMHAAMHCKKNANVGSQFVFSNIDAYGTYPIINLVKLYFHTNQHEEAYRFAMTYKHLLADNEEFNNIFKELERIRELTTFDWKDAKYCDDIIISCFHNAYEWDGNIYRNQGIGGSETAEIELAEWMAKLTSRKVIIFNSVPTERHINGVIYRPIELINRYVKENKPWLHIAWRHNQKITDALTIVHSHDLQTIGIENLSNFDKVAVLTPWHRDFMNATQGVPFDKMFLTRNGIVPSRFEAKTTTKDPYSFGFSSSPDRGLDRAMLVLDKVREVYPQITLKVFYGIEHLPKYGHQALHDKLKEMMAERKEWVTYYGKTEQKQMMKHFESISYVVQPSNFLETFGISVLEQVCSGIYPIFRLIGGIADTLQPFVDKGFASLVDSDCVTEEEFQKYIDEVLLVLKENRAANVKVDPSQYSWQNVAKEWLDEVNKLKGNA